MISTAPVDRAGYVQERPYRWRARASEAQQAELEELRLALDRQAGYGGAQGRRLPPAGSEARRAAGRANAARRKVPAAVAETAPAVTPEPEAPDNPAPVQPQRCRACRYLVTSVGHRVNCGS